MLSRRCLLLFVPAPLAVAAWLQAQPPATPETPRENLEWMLPDDRLIQPFAAQQPIRFVTSTQNAAEWAKLPAYWNEVSEQAYDPAGGTTVSRKAVVIKAPLGLTQAPPVPVENPITVAKWVLGKQLFFDPILSSSNDVSCATCHAPQKGYTDQMKVSRGIHGKLGGASARRW